MHSTMRSRGCHKIGRRHISESLDDVDFGPVRIIFDSKKLGHMGQIFLIIGGVIIVLGPLLGNISSKRKHAMASSSSKEMNASLNLDSLKKHAPFLVL
jgi:hypothetical protein